MQIPAPPAPGQPCQLPSPGNTDLRHLCLCAPDALFPYGACPSLIPVLPKPLTQLQSRAGQNLGLFWVRHSQSSSCVREEMGLARGRL